MIERKEELRRLSKAGPLFALSFLDIGVAFARMFALAHILGPFEFGFAAAISVTAATIGQITDIALYRFVSSSARSVFVQTIAAAHAVSVLRAIILAVLIVLFSYPIACTLVSCGNWPSFAWFAPIVLIASFENMEIRTRERDYRYWPQLIAAVTSYSAGIISLTIVAYETRSHYAFLSFMAAQTISYVFVSHLLASTPYRLTFCSKYVTAAVSFGIPLMLNGAGLALVGQGDRLMVGAVLGVEFLGLYAVVVLAGLVPIAAITRICGSLFFAGLHNTNASSEKHNARMRLFSRLIAVIASSYALAVIGLFNVAVPVVFGARFLVPDLTVFLISLIAFVRIVRGEPMTSVLLNKQRTRALAVANLSPALGLIAATLLVVTYRTIDSVLAGILVGEFTGVAVLLFTTRDLFRPAFLDYVLSSVASISIVVCVGLLALFTPELSGVVHRVLIAGSGMILILVGSLFCLPKIYHAAYVLRS